MRALSWWLEWEDLNLGDTGLLDKIKRRADAFAEAGADMAIIFGAHFRWDFLPYWDNLHITLHRISEQLKQRGIRLCDHHSCTLVHRYDNPDELPKLMNTFKHHLPFVPSGEMASTWKFNGDYLNSWRRIDARTGQAAKIPQYSAEQFCISNPNFRAAYAAYLKKLLSETGIDGLMCDDVIYFGGFYHCSCPHCQAKLDFSLPPATDNLFWGNWDNPQWLDYLAMRRKSTGDFLEFVKEQLPKDFPLFSCCTSGAYGGTNHCALSPHDMLRANNILNLEIFGNQPEDVHKRLAESSYHAGLAKKHHVPTLAIGYGYFPDSANHLWALNHMAGFSTWFSTLKGKLGLSKEEMKQLPEDATLISPAFNFERTHPELFTGSPRSCCAVFFSETTKTNSYFGACEQGATRDYRNLMKRLNNAGIAAETIFDFPKDATDITCVIMPSVALMTTAEQDAMEHYLSTGGTILSYGPNSLDGLPQHPEDDFENLWWLTHQEFVDDISGDTPWIPEKNGLLRHGSRNPIGLEELVTQYGNKLPMVNAPGFAVSYRGTAIHLLALDYDITTHPLEQKRTVASWMHLIQNATPKNCAKKITIENVVKQVYCPLGGQANFCGHEITLFGNPMYVIVVYLNP